MHEKNKLKFVPNIWVSFKINNVQIIGRTVVIDGNNVVACVDENGYVGHMDFDSIEFPKKLNIVKQTSVSEELSIIDDLGSKISYNLNLSLMMNNKITQD